MAGLPSGQVTLPRTTNGPSPWPVSSVSSLVLMESSVMSGLPGSVGDDVEVGGCDPRRNGVGGAGGPGRHGMNFRWPQMRPLMNHSTMPPGYWTELSGTMKAVSYTHLTLPTKRI